MVTATATSASLTISSCPFGYVFVIHDLLPEACVVLVFPALDVGNGPPHGVTAVSGMP
jgi:hypothetical protein